MNVFEKKLIKNAEKTVEDAQVELNSVKLLLDNNAQEEINTLKSIGLDVDLRIVETKKEDLLIRGKAKRLLDRAIVHEDEIKALCKDYRLYIKPANQYAGRIPADLGAQLTRFCREKNIALPASSSYSQFYIIAPPKMFKDYLNPVQVVEKAGYVMVEESKQWANRIVESIRLALQPDPILAYRLPDNTEYYGIIESWGNDFTWLRRIYAFFTKEVTMKWMNFLHKVALLYLVFMKASPAMYNYFEKLSNADKNDDGWMLCWVFCEAVLLAIVGIYFWSKPLQTFRSDIIDTVTDQEQRGYIPRIY